MPNPVAHFEIYGEDPVRLGEFYQKLFDWKIQQVPGDYWLVFTVPTSEQGAPTQPGGINGGLMKRPNPESRAWLNYVSVQSVDTTLEQAQRLGATVLRPKFAVPNQGWFAILADPDHNVFGIWQDDPNAV